MDSYSPDETDGNPASFSPLPSLTFEPAANPNLDIYPQVDDKAALLLWMKQMEQSGEAKKLDDRNEFQKELHTLEFLDRTSRIRNLRHIFLEQKTGPLRGL